MRARFAFFLSALCLAAGLSGLPSQAAAPGPMIGAGVLKEPMAGASVVMPYLIAPVVVGDKLFAYAYVSSIIIGPSPTAAVDIREKTPFIQDAYVRDVNATPIGKADDPQTVDIPALAARMLGDAKRIVGPEKVIGVRIVDIQMRQLTP
jgi:hypothetical protein